MFESITPNLMVTDVNRSVEFYTNILGFDLVMGVPEGTKDIISQYDTGTILDYAMVRKDKTELMLHRDRSFKEENPEFNDISPIATMGIYIMVDNLNDFYAQVKSRTSLYKELSAQWYGNKEFYVKDPDGYIFGFAQLATAAEEGK